MTYYRLNEFAKFVAFKEKADTLLIQKNNQIRSLELVIESKSNIINEYELVTIPLLNTKIELNEKEADANAQILIGKENYFKSEKKRLRRGKLQWGVVGISIGAVAVILLGG